MTAAQYSFHDLVLVPLTPIHIGGGIDSVLEPDEFRLSQNALERVNLQEFILAARNCETLLQNLDKNMLGTLSEIRAKVPDTDVIERIAIGEGVYENLKPAFGISGSPGRQRQGTVYAFQRSGGRPIIPGSSLKGCLRTAWLADCVKRKGMSLRSSSGTWSHVKLEAAAFDLDPDGKMIKDPFREITVDDAFLPDEATRINMVSGWKLDRKEKTYGLTSSGKIQNIRERMRSVVDGGEPPVVTFRVGIRGDHVRQLRKKLNKTDNPKHVPGSIYELFSALEAHHEPLWKKDLEKFFPNTGQRLVQALGLFEGLPRSQEYPEAALIRIGWASHAEAKSVVEFRRIQRPQFRGKSGDIAKEGTTRHVVDLPDGPAPFGWAVLVRFEVWRERKPRTWLPIVESKGTRNREEAGGKTGSTAGRKLIYRKHQRVGLTDGSIGTLLADVHEQQSEVSIDIDGDIEPVKILEIRGPA